MVLIPLMFSTLNPKWILGLRMSRSMMTTRLSEKAITPARLMATNVFPSPEMVEVMAITFVPGSFEINWRLVRMERNDSDIADLGFLSTSSCETGMMFLYLGTMPSKAASVYWLISSNEVISL